MKRLFTSSTVLLIILMSSQMWANTVQCQGLMSQASDKLELQTTMLLPNGQVSSPYCQVTGVVSRRIGKEGVFYNTRFELRLPSRWQGRLAYQFNTAFGGEIAPALGKITGLTNNQYAINQGFAVVSSNEGHDNSAFSALSGRLSQSFLFGHDATARKDFAYQAMAQVMPVAIKLAEQYYAAPVQYKYGIGQANGGRTAMVAATRFPNMFDGLLVASPGFNAPKAVLQHAWDYQILRQINDDIRTSLTVRDLEFISRELIRQCDTLDGISDDLIFATDACQTVFKPTSLVCKSEFDRDCLSTEKIGALVKMHKGPHNDKNQSLYSSWFYDTGMQSNNWRGWKISSKVDAWDNMPAGLVLGASALANLYTVPPTKSEGDIYALSDYLASFDFNRDAKKIYAVSKEFDVSPMTMMTPPDAAKPKLTEFKQAGGKMIVFQGNSDPVFSVKDTTRWYDFLDFTLVGKAREFVRFYRIPGMPHQQGGLSTDQFDMLQPLVQWVERQAQPQQVIAATRIDNPELSSRMAGLTRPLCPYPSYAEYWQGDMKSASSFRCVVPR
ncbi:tannase/feruloyl esterase family alpha/beta hydrolase [Marinomonas sp. THO17]|uniref:tannase/feruloyl esterase family alpha/beta hydrolase n=1 Tax=Marinomonas sp. THO17 TaxID=3149048 RepID=UPI00336BB57F